MLLLLLLAVAAHAVAIDVTVIQKGTLENAINQKVSDLESVTRLTVHGPLGSGDMDVWSQLPNLEVLDLSDAEVEFFTNCLGLINLQRVVLPESTKKIDSYTFAYCLALTEVTMPGVEQIDMGAFFGCSSLPAVTLPGTFVSSGGVLFIGCDALKDVYCYSADYSGQLFDESVQGVTMHVHTTLVDYFRQKENFEGLSVVGMTFNFAKLVLGRPTTLSDISYYQGADVSFKPTEQVDWESYTTTYTMGSLTLDAPAQPKWQVGRFTLPVSFYDYETNYSEDYTQEEKVYSIATLLNQRTPMEAQQIEIKLDDRGDMSWTFFSVPFDVKVSDIRGGKGNWVIRRYDPTSRAAVKTGWTTVGASETLHAGEGYIFMRDYNNIDDEDHSDDPDYVEEDDDPDAYRIILPAAESGSKQQIFNTGDVVVPLKKSAAELSHNADWNMVGNPYPCYFDISAIKEHVTIYIYDDYNEQYRAFDTSITNGVYLAPCQTFFVQATDVSQLTFQATGRRAQARFGLPELNESTDDESALSRLPAEVRQLLDARKPAPARAAVGTEFNPDPPLDPGANYYNPTTGEAYFDLFPINHFSQAVRALLDESVFLVKTVTVTAPLGEWDMLFTVFSNAEKVDLGRSSGFTTVSDGTFQYMMELRHVVLPSCVTAIEDEAFYTPNIPIEMKLDQLDLYATTPPAVTEQVFAFVKDKSSFVVRVPQEAVAAYKAAPVWKDFNIKPLEGGEQLQSVRISVLTPEGEELSSQCNIVWRDAEGSILGVGNLLEAQAVGTVVNYSVSLPASMSLLYEPVTAATYTVQASGNLITINLVATGVVDLGARNMQGTYGTLDYSLQPSDPSLPVAIEIADVLLTIRDKQTDAALTDFLVQYPALQFEQTRLEAGQVIVVGASSRTGRFEETQVEATADADGNFEVALIFKERGHARITCTREEASASVTALVFDAQGRYASRFFANGNIVTVKDLPDGNYTAVVMEESPFFSVVASLDDLQQTQLRKGTDYAKVAIRLTAGTTTDYAVNVPALDESRLCHTSSESYIATNDPIIPIVSTATMKAKVVFKEEYAASVSNVRLIVNFPEGTSYVDNSLLTTQSDGSYQYANQRLIVPCLPGEQVRFCLEATTSGVKDITVMVQYNLNGQLYTQPLGATVVLVMGIELNLLTVTNTPDIHIKGNGIANSSLTFYDGERVIGTATSKSNGGFEADVTLLPAYDHTYHDVYAIVQPAGGEAINTENTTVFLDRDGSVLSKVTMIYQDQRIVWDKAKGGVSPRYYDVVPERGGITTFTAQLQNPQPDNIFFPNFLVTTNDGLGYELPATWDESSQLYTATWDFPGITSLPVGADFSYEWVAPAPADLGELFDAHANSLMDLFNSAATRLDEKMQVKEVKEATEDRVIVTFNIDGQPQTFKATVQLEDVDRILAMRDEYIFMRYECDTDSFTYYANSDDNGLKIYMVNLTTNEACSMVFGYDDESNGYSNRPRRVMEVRILSVVNSIRSAGDFMNNMLSLSEWQELLNAFYDVVPLCYMIRRFNYIDMVVNNGYGALYAFCPDGQSRVPESLIPAFESQLEAKRQEGYKLKEQMFDILHQYFMAVIYSIDQQIGVTAFQMIFAKAAKAGLDKNGIVQKVFGKITNNFKIGQVMASVDDITTTLSGAVSDITGEAVNSFFNQALPKDYKGIRKYLEKFVEEKQIEWSASVQQIVRSIIASYKDCDELKPHITKIKIDDEVSPIIDPSGFVYEATPENRVEGVTATLYYKEHEGAAEEQWDAEEYGQQNPLETDVAGLYMWNVPKGLWQVRFEKEGYEPTKTEWLPVPPPQLEINVPLTRNSAPEVSRAQAFADGVSIDFDRYMKTASLQGITVRQNGQQAQGAIEPVGETNGVARSVRFRPAADFTASTVELTIPTTAKSYADVALASAYTATLTVERVIEGLLVQEDAAIQVGHIGYVSVTAYPAAAVSGKTLSISTRSPLINLDATEVSFDSNGQCLVPVSGLLPGVAQVTFAIGDLQAKADVAVKYHLNEVCANPVATVMSGTAVAPGIEVELYCATEGATIYYTTDGSCPCDEDRRQVYIAPIVINEPVTIQAIAVCDGLDDSDVITLTYSISDATLVMQPQQDIVTESRYYNLRGMQVHQPLPRGLYIHVQRTPQGITSKKIWIGQ